MEDDSSIPENPFSLTEFIQRNYPLLKSLKKRGVGDKGPWLDRLGAAISMGITVERLSAGELGAAIFVVNRLHHRGDAQATTAKMHLQRVLVTRHYGACKVQFVKKGSQRGTYLVRVSCWETHVPVGVFPKIGLKKPLPTRRPRFRVRTLNVYHAR